MAPKTRRCKSSRQRSRCEANCFHGFLVNKQGQRSRVIIDATKFKVRPVHTRSVTRFAIFPSHFYRTLFLASCSFAIIISRPIGK